MELSRRTSEALEIALRDPGATKEILASIVDQELVFENFEGVASVDQLPTTGLVIDQHTSVITESPDADVIIFDCSVSDWHSVTLNGNRTLALTNVGSNQEFTIILVQATNTAQTVVWFNGIRWAGGSPPNLSNKAGLLDVFKFKQLSPGVYLGFVVGLAF